MPIQFENTFVNPNIQVKGTEIPLEQLEKTSNILQDRYDKSYENLTKFQVLAKQAEQIADPLERDKVKQYIASYQPAIDQMAKDDALHRVGWKTMAMANEAAGNLKMFQDRAAEIKAIKEKIATTSIEDVKTREYFQNMLDQATKQTTYDPTKQSFNFQSINMPNVVKDYDYAKFLFGAGNDWKADTFGNSMKDVVVLNQDQVDAKGNLIRKAGVYNKKDMSEVSQVKYNEVKNNILKALKGSPGAMEALDRDVNVRMWEMGIDGKDPKNKELKDKVYNEIYKEKVLGVAEAVANKNAYISTKKVNELDYDKDASFAWGVGATEKPGVNPTSLRQSEQFKPNENPAITTFFDDLRNTGFSPNALSFNKQSDAAIQKFQENPKNKNIIKLLANSLGDPTYLKELQKTNPELYNKITSSKIHTYDNGMNKFSTSTNIYDIQNTLSDNKPLSALQMSFLQNLAQDKDLVLPSAYMVRNKDDQSFRKEMTDFYGDATLTNKAYDPIKADALLNHSVFEDEKGLVISKDAKGELKGLNTGASKGLLIMDPITGTIKPFSQYLEENKSGLPDETKITVTGKVEPGSLKQANSNNPYNGKNNAAKAFGNSYTIDVNGQELVVANPLDVNSTNATISELSKFTEGVNPEETVPIWLTRPGGNVLAGNLKIQSSGRKVIIKGMGINEVMTADEYKDWIREYIK